MGSCRCMSGTNRRFFMGVEQIWELFLKYNKKSKALTKRTFKKHIGMEFVYRWITSP